MSYIPPQGIYKQLTLKIRGIYPIQGIKIVKRIIVVPPPPPPPYSRLDYDTFPFRLA